MVYLLFTLSSSKPISNDLDFEHLGTFRAHLLPQSIHVLLYYLNKNYLICSK